MEQDSTDPQALQNSFDKLEYCLQDVIENVRQTSIMVSDFQPQGQNNLNQKIHGIVANLQEIDKCKHNFSNVTVPISVLEYIDQGRNPQLYTKDLMERALDKNEQVKGKIEVYEQLRDALTSNIKQSFPQLVNQYEQYCVKVEEEEALSGQVGSNSASSNIG